ncbi:MAG: creatininase family protein, partial [Actinobacteria bacterium]|nr:creatininase family protein [Actinomycetota bacterium]
MPIPEVRHMRTPEVIEAVETGRIPVVPVATLETHDPHLPVDVDTRCAEEVVLRAARQRPDLLLAFPPVHYGYTEHTMDFPGGFSIRPQILLEFYYDIGESIAQNGFRRLLFVNGHGSNAMIMNLAARLVTLRTPALAAATSWWELCRRTRDGLRESEFPGGMAHACEFETSAYLYLEPESVQHDLIEDCVSSMNNEWTYSDLAGSGPIHLVPWWSQTSATGTEGRPTLATADKGEAFDNDAVESLIAIAEAFRELE